MNWVLKPQCHGQGSSWPFALSLQRIVFSLFSQHYTGAHSGCLCGRVWSSKVLAFHDSVFPSLQVWVLISWMFHVRLCPSPVCVNGPGLLMDQVTHSFPSSVTHKLYQLLFLLSDPGWNAILHLTYANLKSIIECNLSLASFWDMQAGHFLILLVCDYVQ